MLSSKSCRIQGHAASRKSASVTKVDVSFGGSLPVTPRFCISRLLDGVATPCRFSESRWTPVQATLGSGLVFVEGYTEVEEVLGMRVHMDGDTPKLDYLVKWKDGTESTWEPSINLSEDLVRLYEDNWWQAARKADLQALAKMLAGGREALAMVVDENTRSALHFAAGLGKVDCVKILVEAGANVNLQDKEGYTPLHMAAGYMHTACMAELLEAGADPEIKDNTGKDVVKLVDQLRNSMPLSAGSITRRIALEQVASVLTERIYEEVLPSQILNARKRESDGVNEYLVQFPDGRDDEWVEERDMSPDVLEDYELGLEYATAENIVDVVQVGTARRFKVAWRDGYPTSWEAEEHLPSELITLFQQENPQLFEQRISAGADADASGEQAWPSTAELEWGEGETEAAAPAGYQTQYAPLQIKVTAPTSSSSSPAGQAPGSQLTAEHARETAASST